MTLSESIRSKSIDRRDVLLVLGAGLGSALLPASQSFAATAQVGQPAPDFTLTDTGGIERKISALRGKVVVLEWTNNECPFVRKHYESGNMQSLQHDAKNAGVVWLSVISSAPGEQGYVEAAKANELTTARNAAPAGILLDPNGKIGRIYGAQTTPHMYVIDATGVLRYAGGIDSIASTNKDDLAKAQPYFKDALQAVIKGDQVKAPVTKPYGCSVKYAA
jgi:peroxiredoxin